MATNRLLNNKMSINHTIKKSDFQTTRLIGIHQFIDNLTCQYARMHSSKICLTVTLPSFS